MKIDITGNPGTGNTFQEIHIDYVENYNPNATMAVTKHYHGAEECKKVEYGNSVSRKEESVDKELIRKDILAYVNRLRLYLNDKWKSHYTDIWNDIIDLEKISPKIYVVGKQQNTNFNRKLVANIISYLNKRGVFNEMNPTAATIALERNKEHSVRGALATTPDTQIVSNLDNYFDEQCKWI